MNEETRKMLDERIKAEMLNLDSLEAGTSEKSKVIDDLATLYKLKLDEEKLQKEYADKAATRKEEQDSKAAQLKEQVKDRWVRIVIAGVELIVPLVFYGGWINKGLKFEETGSLCSKTFMGFINKVIKPTRK